MVAAEQHQQGRGCGRHEEKPGFGEGIRIEETLSLGLVAHGILLGLRSPVENRKIQVRGGDVLSHICLVRPEEGMRDE